MSKTNATRIKRIGAYIMLLSILAAFFCININAAYNFGNTNYGEVNADGYLLWAETSQLIISSTATGTDTDQTFNITIGGKVSDEEATETSEYIDYIYDINSGSLTAFETQTHGSVTVSITKSIFTSSVYVYVVSGKVSDWVTYPDGWERNALGAMIYRFAQAIVNGAATGTEASQFVFVKQNSEKTINQMYDEIASIKNDITTLVNYEYVAEAPELQPSEQEQAVLGDVQDLGVTEKLDELRVRLDAALDVIGFTVAGTTMKTVIEGIISIQAILVLTLVAGALLIFKVLIT